MLGIPAQNSNLLIPGRVTFAAACVVTLGVSATSASGFSPNFSANQVFLDPSTDVDFDLNQTPQTRSIDDFDSHVYSDAATGLKLTATGRNRPGTTPSEPRGLSDLSYAPGQGIGVESGDGDSSDVSGAGLTESIWFTTSENVDWTSVTFSGVDPVSLSLSLRGISIDLGDDDVHIVGEDDETLANASLFTIFDEYATLNLAALGYSGQTIGFEALDPDDDWRVSNVSVSAIDSPDVTPVPTPTSGAAALACVLTAGLTRFGGRRRRA